MSEVARDQVANDIEGIIRSKELGDGSMYETLKIIPDSYRLGDDIGIESADREKLADALCARFNIENRALLLKWLASWTFGELVNFVHKHTS